MEYYFSAIHSKGWDEDCSTSLDGSIDDIFESISCRSVSSIPVGGFDQEGIELSVRNRVRIREKGMILSPEVAREEDAFSFYP
jgi:hypothetical protein